MQMHICPECCISYFWASITNNSFLIDQNLFVLMEIPPNDLKYKLKEDTPNLKSFFILYQVKRLSKPHQNIFFLYSGRDAKFILQT